MTDQSIEMKKDLEHINKLLRRLQLLKEQEIIVYKSGKRLSSSGIKQMREIEATITAVMNRRRLNLSVHQRAQLENIKNKYHSSMRSWKNRIAFTDLRKKKKLKKQQRQDRQLAANAAAAVEGKTSTDGGTD